ncbi:hypothetical protein [Lutibacter oricola]|nr:hypothetical protein [Lutibacter oricola]
MDTVYIHFDNAELEMTKKSFKSFKSKKYPNENIKTSYIYKIAEKKHDNIIMTDSGYKFTHYLFGKFDLERGAKQPKIIVKNKSFLQSIKLLDYSFFKNTDYNAVCKTFESDNSWEQNVIIFIIDKKEIKNETITLREVRFSRPIKE